MSDILAAEANLVLTGFMGSGKTTVGRIVAARLSRPFIDMDALIESETGQTIPHLFATQGEAAFRALETDVCRRLSVRSGLVLATGGGTLLNSLNRIALEATGRVICLLVRPETSIERLAGHGGRPLLAEVDPLGAARRILVTRDAIYASFPWRIETDGRTPEDIADEALRMWLARRLTVGAPAGDYTLHIQDGALDALGRLLADLGRRGSLAIVSNPTVWELYGQRALTSAEKAGFVAAPCLMPDGEEHKTLATVAGLYEGFLDAGLDRSGTVVALGGGVVGDVAGFAAATYLRGLSIVQVPTTLLSMIDSSVGGKTGVDLPRGKNLIGAFHPPALVIVDPQTLTTLPARQAACGLAETLKHALIGDPTLFQRLESGQSWDWIDLITRSVTVKVAVVEEDPFERGRRAVLNLGHTSAHALERLSGYRLPHGEAVAVGLLVAAHIAARQGRCAVSLPGRIATALTALGLPVTWAGDFSPTDVRAAMAHDKKRLQGRLRWVLPRDVGDVAVFDDVPDELVLAALAQTRDEH